MLRRSLCVAVSAMLVWSSSVLTTSADPIQYLDQTRLTLTRASVEEGFDVSSDAGGAEAADFADFSHFAEADVFLPVGFATANSLHESSLQPDAIMAFGVVNAATAIDPFPEVGATAAAVSGVDVSFIIDKTFDAEIFSQVSLSLEGAGGAEVVVLLEGPGGTIFSETLADVTGSSERLEHHTLDPGEYRFRAAVLAESEGTGVSYGAFLVGVIVPEPATAALVLGVLFIVPSRRRRSAEAVSS